MTGRIAAFAIACAAVAGCAPDAWTNVKATGFNAWVDRMAVECAPVYAGPLLITRNFRDPAWDQQSYDYFDQWLDQASRAYYKRIPPETFVQNVSNLFGDRSRASAQCMAGKIPAQTEPAPSRLQ